MKGSEIHSGWEKGATIKRGRGYLVRLLDDGNYIDGGSYGLWHFRAIRENGIEETAIPEVGDTPIDKEASK